MGSLNSLISVASAALQNAQFALDTTSDNVANQNTPGYTREIVTWSSGDRVTLSATTAYIAPTVTATSQRDSVLEQRVQQQTQVQSSTDAQSSVLSEIENIFNLSSTASSSDSTPIGTALDLLFSSFTALTGASTNTSTRQGVLSAASTLANTFNAASNQLSQIASTINTQLASTATQVNTLTATIATLNNEITTVSPRSDPGTLADQRQNAVTQLSKLIGLDQITTENNGITLTTTGGATLVGGGRSFNITTQQIGGTTHVYDSDGNDVTAGTVGGTIGGLLTAQSTQLLTVRNALDSLAYTVGTEVNAQNAAGLTPSGTAGTAIFNLPASSTGAAEVISVIPTSVAAIAAASTTEGASGSSNATALANIATTTNASGETLSETYAALLSQVGSTASALNSLNTDQQTTLTTLTAQRDSYSAVSLDEEASNLTTYQRSYEAAAKLFTVADTIFASALDLGVATSVS